MKPFNIATDVTLGESAEDNAAGEAGGHLAEPKAVDPAAYAPCAIAGPSLLRPPVKLNPAPIAINPRDPDYSRPGIFATHNCWKCKDGTDLSRCPTPDRPGNCGYPHARND